jgi:hypothetical protein
MMTVKELKEKLEQFDDSLIVMLADDASEWGYFPLRNIAQGFNEFDGCLFLDDYIEEECATCIHYNTDRKDQPCCSCVDWENWEKGVN